MFLDRNIDPCILGTGGETRDVSTLSTKFRDIPVPAWHIIGQGLGGYRYVVHDMNAEEYSWRYLQGLVAERQIVQFLFSNDLNCIFSRPTEEILSNNLKFLLFLHYCHEIISLALVAVPLATALVGFQN